MSREDTISRQFVLRHSLSAIQQFAIMAAGSAPMRALIESNLPPGFPTDGFTPNDPEPAR